MPVAVDFGFIHTLEGARVLTGYVPDASGSDSGVTIGSGVDLGQRGSADLDRLGLSATLKAKLEPYLGLKKQDAIDKLEAEPLSISKAEADELDEAVKRQHVDALIAKFDAASETRFENLDAARQTVIASVSFQYGVALNRRAPNFWRQITEGDWEGALANLRNFGDRYTTRRNKEADLLEPTIEV